MNRSSFSIENIVQPKGFAYRYSGKPPPSSSNTVPVRQVAESSSSDEDRGEKIEIKLDFRKPFDQFFNKFGMDEAPAYLSSIPSKVA